MDLHVESTGEGHKGRERWIGLLSGEQATDRFWLHASAAGEVGLREVQLLPTVIENPDHTVDLIDAIPSLFVCAAVLGIIEPVCEVPLCPSQRLAHT